MNSDSFSKKPKYTQNKQYHVLIESETNHIHWLEIHKFYKLAVYIGLSPQVIYTILQKCRYDEKQSVVCIWQTILRHRQNTFRSIVLTVKHTSENPYRTRAVHQ